MSNFGDAVQGLATILGTAIGSLQTYNHPVDAVNSYPAAVILPETLRPQVGLGGSSFVGEVRIIFLVASGDSAQGFTQLYEYIDTTTSTKSVPKAISDNPTLGGKVDAAQVTLIENIGRRQIGGGYQFGFDAIVQFVKGI